MKSAAGWGDANAELPAALQVARSRSEPDERKMKRQA